LSGPALSASNPSNASCCEFCHGHLQPRYRPDRTRRDLTVHVCQHCGLVQSTPRVAHQFERQPAAISGGADWGNVRYGKGFRTAPAMDALRRHADLDANLAILDVGANRGSFAHAVLEAAPHAALTALEPDERFSGATRGLPRTRWIEARIEDMAFADASFDIVHSCHTIEHLAAPFTVLRDHARILKHGGLLVIDAPNIALTGGADIVEEWFIDKHLFHFSAHSLSRMITAAGFSIVEQIEPADAINLLFVARRSGRGRTAIAADLAEVEEAERLLARYRQTRARNLAALAVAAHTLASLKPRRFAIWGAGRLFDLLVTEGGFDPRQLTLLIDGPLKQYMPSRHGVPLSSPQALAATPVETILVMSRGFAGEIAREARALAPAAEIIFYSDLLARARLAPAA
jgi:2-polyprenyl-3-methyl-5-hydroxy-6-metoxy-1,4-benzoquinol methylase